MRWMALLLPLLSGCFLFSRGSGSSIENVPSHLRDERIQAPEVTDLHPYGPVSTIAAGSWATYLLTRGTEIQKLTLAAVAREDEKVWIEIIEEGEPRRVSSRRVSPDGLVDQAWYVEARSDGSKTPPQPQAILQYSAPPRPALTFRNREVKEEERILAGSSLTVSVVRTSSEDFNGRTFLEEMVWSKSVPSLYAGGEEGGLVRKSGEGLTVELTAFGTRAKPLVEIPK